MNQSPQEALIAAMNEHQRLQRFLPNLYGIPRGEFYTLRLIQRLSEELAPQDPGIRASELSRQSGVSKPGVSQMLNALQKKELVTRTIAQNDRRGVYVRLTEKGNLLMENTCQFLNRMVGEIAKRLGDEDTLHLANLINRLNAITQEIDFDHLMQECRDDSSPT